MNTQSRLLTDGEAANLVRMLPTRLLKLAKAGVVPSVTLPDGEYRFLESDLWDWIASHRHVPAEVPADDAEVPA